MNAFKVLTAHILQHMFIHEHGADDVWNKPTLNPWLSQWFVLLAGCSCAVLQHFDIQSLESVLAGAECCAGCSH